MSGNVASLSGHIALHNNRGVDVTHAPYNAVGDGETDDTEAIQAALDDAPAGGSVFFPSGRYRYTHLTVDKPLKLFGAASQAERTAGFGSSSWDTPGGEYGSVLECTSEEGTSIDVADGESRVPVTIEDLYLHGIGGDLRTVIGLRLTHQFSRLSRVVFSNFATGLWFDDTHGVICEATLTVGCDVGVLVEGNANTFLGHLSWGGDNTSIQVKGTNNSFYGGVVQGYMVRGVHLVGTAEENLFSAQYFEADVAATDDILFDSDDGAKDDNTFWKPHFSGTSAGVRVLKGNGNAFHLAKYQPISITFASGTGNNLVDGRGVGEGSYDIVDESGWNLVLSRIGQGFKFDGRLGFHGGTPIEKPSVAVTAEAIHAALVSYGLIEGV